MHLMTLPLGRYQQNSIWGCIEHILGHFSRR